MITQSNSLYLPFASGIAQTCVTSPPYYGLRDYGVAGQIGLEQTPEAYIARLVEVFREVRRVLKDDGTAWLNLGDSYTSTAQGTTNSPNSFGGRGRNPEQVANYRPVTGLKPKDLLMIPARVAIALQADGWYLRSEIIWHKPNPMPESVKDRPTKAHEMIYLLAKSQKYYYDADAVKTPTKGTEHDKRARIGRKRFPTEKVNGIRNTGYYPMANLRDVWAINCKSYKGAHFATFPPRVD